MRAPSRTIPLLLTALAAACDQPTPVPEQTPAPPSAANPAKAAGKTPPKRELPKLPALTEEKARSVLRSQLDDLAGDDVSRQALLYLVDLGDRAGVNAAHEKLLAVHQGEYEDLAAASLGVETLLAYGEPGAGAKALEVAKGYETQEEDPDEYLAYMLGRVTGAERDAAVAELVKIAQSDADEEVAAVAVEELARLAAPEARAAFLAVASNKDFEGVIRGAAVAGLLRLGDPKAKELADGLFPAAGSKNEDGPEPEDVIEGLGVEGATEAGPYIRKAVDASLTEEGLGGVWEVPAAASALARIHRAGGGAEYVPWLREIGQRDDAFHEDDTAIALFALGDDASAALVAEGLEGTVAAGWAQPSQMEGAVEILDIAARRGLAAKAPFLSVVSCAAQLDPTRGSAEKGIDFNLRSLSLAAAHAYLKSLAK